MRLTIDSSKTHLRTRCGGDSLTAGDARRRAKPYGSVDIGARGSTAHPRQVGRAGEPQPTARPPILRGTRHDLQLAAAARRLEVHVTALSRTSASLGHCEGFVIDSGGGRIGAVAGVVYDSRSRMPEFLIVRSGALGGRRMMVSVGGVRAILPRQRGLRLQTVWMSIKT